MTTGPVPACPSCKRTFGELDWFDASSGRCRACDTDFELIAFPALTRSRSVAKPQAVAVAEDSTCFFHSQNQAEKVCDGCGRFLCAVCAIPNGGGAYCPACVAKQVRSSDTTVTQRTMFGSVAISLALIPLLVYPFTLVTAPTAVGLAVVGWNKPGSIVAGRQRWKLILGGVLGLLEIGAWIVVFTRLWSK
jgi:hypothetical protein